MLQVRHLLRRLQTVPDTDDAASEQSHCEGSNTDSGRGASDDGEIAVTSSGILKNNRPEIRFHGKLLNSHYNFLQTFLLRGCKILEFFTRVVQP